MKKEKSITFRVSEYEKKQITSRAKSAKMSISDFCRNVALTKEIKHIEGLNDCNFELNKIGNNINQIAVLLHQHRITNPELKSIENKLFTVLDKVVEILCGGDEHSHRQPD